MTSDDAWKDSYDAWKTNAPDPGSGDGRDQPMVLTCRDCAWRVSDRRAGVAFTTAVAHVDQTGHTLLFKGVPQDVSQALQRVRNARARAEQEADPPILTSQTPIVRESRRPDGDGPISGRIERGASPQPKCVETAAGSEPADSLSPDLPILTSQRRTA